MTPIHGEFAGSWQLYGRRSAPVSLSPCSELFRQQSARDVKRGQGTGAIPLVGLRDSLTPVWRVTLRTQGRDAARAEGTRSILGEAIHPVLNFTALYAAVEARAWHTGESAAEGAHKRRQQATDQLQ
jgi:hypothetical protein